MDLVKKTPIPDPKPVPKPVTKAVMGKVARPLRQKIMAFVGALTILSVLGSAISLYRITEVNQVLDLINRVAVPLGRLLIQVQVDADLYKREFDRSLGSSHWKDPHWRPRGVSKWVTDVLESELTRSSELMGSGATYPPEASEETRIHWKEWSSSISDGLEQLKNESVRLEQALELKDEAAAERSYAHWNELMDQWKRQLQWGAAEYDRSFRQTFSIAEKRISELRTGLEMILIVVISLSLMLVWLGERALRPLNELTRLAREITRRGLKKEDKALLPEISLSRTDEVNQLAREFHNMATALLEREKTVEAQKHRLMEQNTLLRSLGELNENVLNSIEGVLIVTDLHGVITQCNPVTERWLGAPSEQIRGKHYSEWAKIRAFLRLYPEAKIWLDGLNLQNHKFNPCSLRPQSGQFLSKELASCLAELESRIYAGNLMPLRLENGTPGGALWVLQDVTDELDLQDRLQKAESMAAIGRMSAQVAHEVRNPLHSIGLEAELAIEHAQKLGNIPLKQSLSSILSSVDRLEKITDNYLKLSKLSAGNKRVIDLGDVLESVLATYATLCEAKNISVDWKREAHSDLSIIGDSELLEQVLGNLFKNSLQALESVPEPRKIEIALGNTESGKVWLRIKDNGAGIPLEVRHKLFVPFVTTRAQGTGLGLSFVKRVMEEHEGQVSLVDLPLGVRGSCFEIVLPNHIEISSVEDVAHANDPLRI